MFQPKPNQSAIFRTAGRIVKRRVPLEEGYKRRRVVERQQFPVAPHSANVSRIARSGADRPELAEPPTSLGAGRRNSISRGPPHFGHT